MKKLRILLSLLVVICILFTTACSANEDSGTNTTPDSNTETNVSTDDSGETDDTASDDANSNEGDSSELLMSVWAGPHADLQKVIVADYPNGSVTVDDVDYGNLMQKQLTSFQAASGSGNYDVVWVNSQWMRDYVESGYILPIDDFVSESGLDTSIYAGGLINDCIFDDKLYGLPTYAQTMILAYDSAVFEEEGLDVPTNLEELIEVAKHFKEQGSGIAVPAKQGGASSTLFSQLLYSDGGDYFDQDGNLNLTSEQAIYAADAYKQLTEYAVEGSLAWHHDEVAEAVRTKVAPIGIMMSGLANQNTDPEKSLIVDTVAYAPLSGKDGKASASNTFWVWAVAANAQNPKAAYDFCAWMASPEIEKKQTLEDQQISAITSLGEDTEVLEIVPFLPVVMEQLGGGKSDPQLTSFATLKEGLIVTLSEIASTDISAEEAMNKLQESMKDVDFSK